jgi:hypothetical protein
VAVRMISKRHLIKRTFGSEMHLADWRPWSADYHAFLFRISGHSLRLVIRLHKINVVMPRARIESMFAIEG